MRTGKRKILFQIYWFYTKQQYQKEILEMDRLLLGRSLDCAGYVRTDALPVPFTSESIDYYVGVFERWQTEKNLCLKYRFPKESIKQDMQKAFQDMLCLFREEKAGVNLSMLKNFAVKLCFWLDSFLPDLIGKGDAETVLPVIVYSGSLKLQEYLFLYCLYLTGCHVLCLQPEAKPFCAGQRLQACSLEYTASDRGTIEFPPLSTQKDLINPQAASGSIVMSREFFRRKDREAVHQQMRVCRTEEKGANPKADKRQQAEVIRQNRQEELSYEVLATYASSVVMIHAFNKKEECFKTGSGVVINNKGYILTNFHVVCEAEYFGIRMEEEEEMTYTGRIIKYHPSFDLAVLQMERSCRPIPLCRETKPLMRGQKVVAIGSPLGLFNSVSDGIIAGFRKLENVSMIQFTAPVSHGSSGGALLNLHGELIGIITGGYDDGQNLNLAVDYETVAAFAGGLL